MKPTHLVYAAVSFQRTVSHRVWLENVSAHKEGLWRVTGGVGAVAVVA